MDAGYVLWPIGQSWGRTVERAQHQLLLNPLFLGIPVKARYGLAKRPPRRGRWRPSHSVKRPDRLRGLAPQSCFVAARAARSGQDWKGAGNIGRWCGTSTVVRAAGAEGGGSVPWWGAGG